MGVLYRINHGGGTEAATDGGPAWQSDNQSVPSPYRTGGATSYTGGYGEGQLPPGADWGAPVAVTGSQVFGGALEYTYPVTSGDKYRVRLLLAELYSPGITEPGKRIFDVTIDGQVYPEFNDLDCYAIAGGYEASARERVITAGSSNLVIGVTPIVENPAFSATEIYRFDNPAALSLEFATDKETRDRISGNYVVSVTRNSTATWFDANGNMQTAGVDAPRFTHDPVTGESLGLLVESERTNELLISEASTSGWGANGVAVGTDLTLNALGMFPGLEVASGGADSNRYTTWGSGSIAAGEEIAFTAYYREGTSGQCRIEIYDVFNLQSSVLLGTVGSLATGAQSAGTITNINEELLADGLTYRVTFLFTKNASSTTQWNIGVGPYSAVNGETIIALGAQAERASYPTSYIPTNGSTVTRSADLAEITGTDFSNFWTQGPGTFFMEARPLPGQLDNNPRAFFSARDASGTNRITVHADTAGSIIGSSYTSGGVVTAVSGQLDAGTDVRVAYSFEDSSWAFDTNYGALDTSITSSLPTGLTYLQIGSWGSNVEPFNGTISRLLYWPERISDTETESYAGAGAPVTVAWSGPTETTTEAVWTAAVLNASNSWYGSTNTTEEASWAATVSYGIFPAGIVPDVFEDSDPNNYELGTKFSSNQDGLITGLKYYRGANNADDTDVVTLRLWDDTGTVLGSATVTSPPGATGWQVATLASPIAITAGETYTVSYSFFFDNGSGNLESYAITPQYFDFVRTNGPLTAPILAGVFNTTTAFFPTGTFNGSSYWADVVFSIPDAVWAGSTDNTIPANWTASANASTSWTGSTNTTEAAIWVVSTDAATSWTGSTSTTDLASWTASSSASTSWTGSTNTTEEALWVVSTDAASAWTGSTNTTDPADWTASSGASTSWTGSTESTTPAVWTASVDNTSVEASWDGTSTPTDPSIWAATAGAEASWEGTASSPEPAIWTVAAGAAAPWLASVSETDPAVWTSTSGPQAASWAGSLTTTTPAEVGGSVGTVLGTYSGSTSSTTAAEWGTARLRVIIF